MKGLTSLLILTLMTASVVTERLHIENNGKKHVSFLKLELLATFLTWKRARKTFQSNQRHLFSPHFVQHLLIFKALTWTF